MYLWRVPSVLYIYYFYSDLFLLGHRRVVLLPPELPGGPEAGEQVPAGEGRGLVGAGPEAQGKHAQLHHIPQGITNYPLYTKTTLQLSSLLY